MSQPTTSSFRVLFMVGDIIQNGKIINSNLKILWCGTARSVHVPCQKPVALDFSGVQQGAPMEFDLEDSAGNLYGYAELTIPESVFKNKESKINQQIHFFLGKAEKEFIGVKLYLIFLNNDMIVQPKSKIISLTKSASKSSIKTKSPNKTAPLTKRKHETASKPKKIEEKSTPAPVVDNNTEALFHQYSLEIERIVNEHIGLCEQQNTMKTLQTQSSLNTDRNRRFTFCQNSEETGNIDQNTERKSEFITEGDQQIKLCQNTDRSPILITEGDQQTLPEQDNERSPVFATEGNLQTLPEQDNERRPEFATEDHRIHLDQNTERKPEFTTEEDQQNPLDLMTERKLEFATEEDQRIELYQNTEGQPEFATEEDQRIELEQSTERQPELATEEDQRIELDQNAVRQSGLVTEEDQQINLDQDPEGLQKIATEEDQRNRSPSIQEGCIPHFTHVEEIVRMAATQESEIEANLEVPPNTQVETQTPEVESQGTETKIQDKPITDTEEVQLEQYADNKVEDSNGAPSEERNDRVFGLNETITFGGQNQDTQILVSVLHSKNNSVVGIPGTETNIIYQKTEEVAQLENEQDNSNHNLADLSEKPKRSTPHKIADQEELPESPTNKLNEEQAETPNTNVPNPATQEDLVITQRTHTEGDLLSQGDLSPQTLQKRFRERPLDDTNQSIGSARMKQITQCNPILDKNISSSSALGEFSSLKAQIEYLQSIILTKNAQILVAEVVRKENQELHTAFAESEEARNNLQIINKDTIEEYKQQGEQLQTQISQLIKDKEDLLQKHTNSKQQIYDLEGDIAGKNSKITALENQVRSLNSESKEFNALKQTFERVQNDLEASQKHNEEEQKKYKNTVSLCQNSLEEMKALLDKISQEKKDVVQEVQALKAELDQERYTSQSLRDELLSTKKCLENTERYKEIAGGLEADKQVLIKEVYGGKKEYIELQAVLSEARNEFSSKTEEVSRREAHLLDQITSLKKELNVSEENSGLLNKEITELKTKDSELTTKNLNLGQLICVHNDISNQLETAKIALVQAFEGKDRYAAQIQGLCQNQENMNNRLIESERAMASLRNELIERDEYVENLKKLIIEMREAQSLYIPDKDDPIDNALAKYINSKSNPGQIGVLFIREMNGVYQFGSKKIYVKVEGDKILIRVGGGFISIEEFLEQFKNGEIEKSLRNGPFSTLSKNIAMNKMLVGKCVNAIEKPRTLTYQFRDISPSRRQGAGNGYVKH